MSSPKTPKTPQRRRLSLKEKIKIIEDSKKPGFDKAKVMKEYGISRPTIINILKNQFDTLKAVDSGTMNDKSKSLKKSPLAELESQLYEWLCKTTRRGAVISGPLLKSKAKSLYDQIWKFLIPYMYFFFYFLFSDTPRFSDSFLTDQMCH